LVSDTGAGAAAADARNAKCKERIRLKYAVDRNTEIIYKM